MSSYKTQEEKQAYIDNLNQRWCKMEEQNNDNAPTCPSCNTPYRDHLGLIGTCGKLQEIFALVEAHRTEQYYRRSHADLRLWEAVLGYPSQ